jgi:hypothetical protein
MHVLMTAGTSVCCMHLHRMQPPIVYATCSGVSLSAFASLLMIPAPPAAGSPLHARVITRGAAASNCHYALPPCQRPVPPAP